MPISGALSDLIGRRLVLGVSWLVFAALLAPMMRYVMADAGSLPWVTCAAMALIGLGSGAVAAGFAEQFPTRVRAIGWGAPYNISIAVFGARRLTWAHGSPARAGRICSTATSPCSAP